MPARRTNAFSKLIPAANSVLILPENKHRINYAIQNQDAANSVFVSPYSNVAIAGSLMGQEIVAGGYISDDNDLAEVHGIAQTNDVWVSVQEVSVHAASKRSPPHESLSGHSEPRGFIREADRLLRRQAARQRG